MLNKTESRTNKTKLAIFDVDGTLFDGTLGIELLNDLLSRGLFPQDIGQEIFSLYKKYKSDDGDKANIVDEIYILYGKGMEGNSLTEINQAAQITWDRIKHNTFPFTRSLIKSLSNDNYHIVIISGSSIEMVSLFGQEFEIELRDIIAGALEIQNGIYTSKVIHYPGSAEQKEILLKAYLKENNIGPDWANSIAMGNNERDQNILNLCGNAFAFEPNDELKALAKANGWTVKTRDSAFDL